MMMIQDLKRQMREADLKIDALTQIVTNQAGHISELEEEVSELKNQFVWHRQRHPFHETSRPWGNPEREPVYGPGCVYAPLVVPERK